MTNDISALNTQYSGHRTGAHEDAEAKQSGWERRVRPLRPQSYDMGIAIGIAVGMAAAYTLF
jgi:hypothetical protein